MMPTSFHGSSAITAVILILVAVLGITFMAVRMRTSSELSYFKRKSAIVKAEIEQSNQNEVKGIEFEADRGN